jgi:hypothetical protein
VEIKVAVVIVVAEEVVVVHTVAIAIVVNRVIHHIKV